jgi:hypothetical protein
VVLDRENLHLFWLRLRDLPRQGNDTVHRLSRTWDEGTPGVREHVLLTRIPETIRFTRERVLPP